ncbi:MAG TPA: dTDP-4-dehydrorhamnose 3,5-epimerase family protein [Methylomirabilota bacterium]|nr:dTDP-4-dehydrorhamnose 3,5-epimerase family protein [Methylomirabilota bacterium]
MNLSDDAKRAFSTQDYAPARDIAGVEIVDLRRFVDDGGSFLELGRLHGGIHAAFPGFEVKQINYSEMDPGVIKAFHVHRRQSDVWFVPPEDKMLLVLLDVRAGSATEHVQRRLVLGDGTCRLVRIPPGIAHGVKNLAARRGRIIYFVDAQFSTAPDACDEGRLPWDFAGAQVWDVSRG